MIKAIPFLAALCVPAVLAGCASGTSATEGPAGMDPQTIAMTRPMKRAVPQPPLPETSEERPSRKSPVSKPPEQISELTRDIISATRRYMAPPERLHSDQSAIELDPSVLRYYIAYFLETNNLLNSDCDFTMLVDVVTSEIGSKSRNFYADGEYNTFRTFSPGPRSQAANRAARYPPLKDSVNYFVEHSLDFARSTWQIRIDGAEVFSGPINGEAARRVRFSVGYEGKKNRYEGKPVSATLSNLSVLPNRLDPVPEE